MLRLLIPPGLHVAEKFYSTVFNWVFRKDGPGRTEDVALFAFPEKGLQGLGGSISKIKPGEHTTGPKTVKLYLYVNDLEKTMEVSDPDAVRALAWGGRESGGNPPPSLPIPCSW